MDSMKQLILFIYSALFCLISVYCQDGKNIYDEYGTIYIPVNDSTIIYNTRKGERHEVKLNQVYFTDGEDGLKDYLRTECHHSDSDDYGYRVFFFMLFDSKLRIKEIRGITLPSNHYTEQKKKRVKQYIKGLKRTESKWRMRSSQEWYVYCFSFITD